MIRSFHSKGLRRLFQDDDPRGVIRQHVRKLGNILAQLDAAEVIEPETLTMPMKNPPHPGRFLLDECIEPLGLTITRTAAALGVTRAALSELVNGRRGISPEMAVRLSKAFGPTPESWLKQQANYDLAHVQTKRIKVKRLDPSGMGVF